MTDQIHFSEIADLTQKILAEKLSPENLSSKIEDALDKTVNDAVYEALRSWSPAGKAITKAVENSLQVDTDLGLPAYNETIKRMLAPLIDAHLVKEAGNLLQDDIEAMFSKPPSEIKLSKLVEEFKESELYKEDWETGEITLIVEEIFDDYCRIYIDTDEQTKAHSCSVNFSVRNGKITHAKCNGDGFTKQTPVLFGKEYGFTKLMFQLYAAGSRIIIDEDDCDLTYGQEY